MRFSHQLWPITFILVTDRVYFYLSHIFLERKENRGGLSHEHRYGTCADFRRLSRWGHSGIHHALCRPIQRHQSAHPDDLAVSKGHQAYQIEKASRFFIENMGIFFVPAVVGTMEYVETLKNYLLPFLVITLVTTPLIYFVTGWTVQLMLRHREKKGVRHA